MAPRKTRCPIAVDDVPRIFDAAWLDRLAKTERLPAGIDLNRLLTGVRAAASIYATDARKLDANAAHREIEAFYEAALGRKYERTAALRQTMSREAFVYLMTPLKRPGPRAAGLWLPLATDFLDTGPAKIVYRGQPVMLRSVQSRQDEACAMTETVCRIGADAPPGRMRSSGRRSRPTLRPQLHAPALRQRPPRRDAELAFIVQLASAWEAATGKRPARTANFQKPGPFVRFVQQCLDRAFGRGVVSAVKLINRLARTVH
jgi:hypothetical protein